MTSRTQVLLLDPINGRHLFDAARWTQSVPPTAPLDVFDEHPASHRFHALDLSPVYVELEYAPQTLVDPGRAGGAQLTQHPIVDPDVALTTPWYALLGLTSIAVPSDQAYPRHDEMVACLMPWLAHRRLHAAWRHGDDPWRHLTGSHAGGLLHAWTRGRTAHQ